MIVRRANMTSLAIEYTSNMIQELLHANANVHCKHIPGPQANAVNRCPWHPLRVYCDILSEWYDYLSLLFFCLETLRKDITSQASFLFVSIPGLTTASFHLELLYLNYHVIS